MTTLFASSPVFFVFVALAGATVGVIALQRLVQLCRYFGWRDYDLEYGTAYRFNEGAPDDWFFRLPSWLERPLRKWEARHSTPR